ncbi:MAG: hypothetical protein P8P90_09190 [Opitutales bacterium]|nr:hypothetical protein [Opitutales bacterium]
MKLLRGVLPLILLFFSLSFKALAFEIALKNNNWGDASEKEVIAVLQTTADQFVPLVTKLSGLKVLVSTTNGSPIVLHQRTKDEELQIKLGTKNRNWCQYVFQFAHELGHIICGFKQGNQSNQWFEESLCEAASLYALQRLSVVWNTSPPYPNWQSYAPEFAKYRIGRIEGGSYPENFQLHSWWRENRVTLSKNAGLRKQNLWVAVKILSTIEQNPRSAWSACSWLNHAKNGQSKTFEEYLNDWYGACPQTGQKKFVRQVINLFGISTK